MGEKQTMTSDEARQSAGLGGAADPDHGPGSEETPIIKSKSNITNNREGAPDDPDGLTRASNLNLSKSNIDREAGGSDPEPAEGAIVKSKSNITNNRETAGGPGQPEESINLNSSKSNTP